MTILDPTGASPGGPPINETSGAVISVAGQLRNRPGTSSLAYGEHTLSVGNWGEVRAPRLLRFFARDADNLNASCDTGDELIVQFDMAVNRGECIEWSLSTDNLPVCARRPSGGAAFVDSLFGVTALLGTNYSGAWTDGSTFAITITDAPRELAPAPFNTLLKVPAGANVRNANATSDALVFGPELMGAAERFETFPEPPVLTSIVANDFANVDLRVGPGDTITIAFDRPTDRGVDSAGTPRNGECTWAWNNAGTQRVRTQDLSNCELHRLFDLLRENDKGQHVKITEPLFLEYEAMWHDDMTLVVNVLNGTEPAVGILHPEYAEGRSVLVDGRTKLALKADATVRLKECPLAYGQLEGEESAYLSHCTALAGRDAPAPTPHLAGHFGRLTAPQIASFAASDPDNGDRVFGDGDILTIIFDQRTNMGQRHTNFMEPHAWLYAEKWGEAPQLATYPFGADATSGGREYVDSLFNFSQPLGDGYSGAWVDDSTFRVRVNDASTGGDPVNPEQRPSLGGSNVTVTPWSAITSANYTSKVCNLTDVDGNVFDRYIESPIMLNSTLWWCQLQYANATSPFLSGSFGVPTYPTLVDFYVLDPDNGDDEYSNGDVLHLNFDMDTNRPACGGGASNASGASGGGKALVDCLFDFSHSLGADYEGEWATAARFAITVIDATGASVSVTSPATRATVVSTDVRNARGDALTGHNSSATLRGEFGRTSEPTVDRFTVVVAANASNYTDGDTMVLHLDMATNQCPAVEGASSSAARCVTSTGADALDPSGVPRAAEGDKLFVDSLFGFSAMLGTDYSGAWEDGESSRCADGGATTVWPCFVIHLIDTRGGAAASGRTIAAPTVHVRNVGQTSARSFHRLSGDLGRRLPPRLVDLYVHDADNSAKEVDAGDAITLVFDTPTDLGVSPPQRLGDGVGGGAVSGGKAYVDSLFRFCETACDTTARMDHDIADDYSGAWADHSTFVVTLTDVTTASDLALGTTVAQSRHRTDVADEEQRRIRFQGGVSDYTNGTSPALRGSFGDDAAPAFVAFEARDPDNADTAYSAFDAFALRLSMPTDRGGLGGAALASELDLSGNAAAWNARSGDKRWVDRWFNFSCSLGLDYSGEWAAAEAPLITVLDATIGVDPLVVEMSQVQVTPAATAHIQNKPRNANAGADRRRRRGAADPGLADRRHQLPRRRARRAVGRLRPDGGARPRRRLHRRRRPVGLVDGGRLSGAHLRRADEQAGEARAGAEGGARRGVRRRRADARDDLRRLLVRGALARQRPGGRDAVLGDVSAVDARRRRQRHVGRRHDAAPRARVRQPLARARRRRRAPAARPVDVRRAVVWRRRVLDHRQVGQRRGRRPRQERRAPPGQPQRDGGRRRRLLRLRPPRGERARERRVAGRRDGRAVPSRR